jgi:hypothetical protein
MTDAPSFYTGWTEPESAANTDFQPEYPYNHITQTESGHAFEMDDTPGRERVRLNHRNGTFIEMHPNGDQVIKIQKDGYTITLGDHNIGIGIEDGKNASKLNITVFGDVNLDIRGNKTEKIGGNYEQHIEGNFFQSVVGSTYMVSQGDSTIGAGAGILGTLTLAAGNQVFCASDFRTNGEITAEKITSVTRVDAGTGVGAGPLGFVTMTGGVSVGIPVAVPTQINAVGPINSLVSISAPLGNFGISDSVWMFDVVNTLLYDIHVHPAPDGTTGPTPMTFDV